jgi:hypothetical protein
MKKEQLEKLMKLDEERKNLLYVAGELSDLSYWLDDGYKEGEGKKLALLLIKERIDDLKSEAESILSFILFKKKKYE